MEASKAPSVSALIAERMAVVDEKLAAIEEAARVEDVSELMTLMLDAIGGDNTAKNRARNKLYKLRCHSDAAMGDFSKVNKLIAKNRTRKAKAKRRRNGAKAEAQTIKELMNIEM